MQGIKDGEEQLVLDNTGLVVSLAKKFCPKNQNDYDVQDVLVDVCDAHDAQDYKDAVQGVHPPPLIVYLVPPA